MCVRLYVCESVCVCVSVSVYVCEKERRGGHEGHQFLPYIVMLTQALKLFPENRLYLRDEELKG